MSSLKSKNYSFTHKVEHVSRFDNKSENTWEYEVEDLIYPEILIRAVNKILNKKGYTQLKVQATITKKNQPTFQKDAILPFITTQVKDVNLDKEELNFEELGLKKYLCTSACSLLVKVKEKELDELNKKYKEVTTYLKKISEPFQ